VSSDNKRLTKLYEAVWAEIHRIVNDSDPEDLLNMGAPDDEYDDAVGMLTRQLISGKQILPQELESWFWVNYGLRASAKVVASIVTEMDEVRKRLL
jgi:hypothetical protein